MYVLYDILVCIQLSFFLNTSQRLMVALEQLMPRYFPPSRPQLGFHSSNIPALMLSSLVILYALHY